MKYLDVGAKIRPGECDLLGVLRTMDKIAAAAIMTETIFDVGYTFLGLVFGVGRIVFTKFVVAMGKFTFLLIWAISEFSEFLAQL